MRGWLLLYLLELSDACSSSTTSKNGWDIDAMEDQIILMNGQIGNLENQVQSLQGENNDLMSQLADVEDSLSCSIGTLSVCSCPTGTDYVPFINDAECINLEEYRFVTLYRIFLVDNLYLVVQRKSITTTGDYRQQLTVAQLPFQVIIM